VDRRVEEVTGGVELRAVVEDLEALAEILQRRAQIGDAEERPGQAGALVEDADGAGEALAREQRGQEPVHRRLARMERLAHGAEPWTMEARCVSSKSSAWPCAPLASAASSALVRRPRPRTVACGSPPLAATTASSAAASGSVEPRMAAPTQSVKERPAAATTA